MSLYQFHCFSMGTRFNIVIPDPEKRLGDTTGQAIFKILQAQEALLSCFDENSEVSGINRQAFHKPVIVSGEMAEVMNVLDDFWKRTFGAFDPGLLSVTMPMKNLNQYAVSMDGCGWRFLEWHAEKQEVRFLNDSVGLDLGGFGKGWALQKVINHLKIEGVESAFISFGESTISVIGSHPLGDHWPVTIKHPHSEASLHFKLVDESISVSGLAQVNNQYIPHIMSPHTGSFVKADTIAVVRSSSPLEAEVLSTAILASDESGLRCLVQEFDHALLYLCGAGDHEFKVL